jgi:hypothetical protein
MDLLLLFAVRKVFKRWVLIFVCFFYFYLFMLMGFSILCRFFASTHSFMFYLSILFFSFFVWFWLFICFLLGDTDLFPFLLCYRLLWPSKPLIHLALSGDPGYETKVVVRICQADGIDMFLALLVMDGSCMID